LTVKELSLAQRELVSALARRLGTIRGVEAVALAGSYARGRAGPGSDIDLGIFYSEAAPFAIGDIRELAEAVNDTTGPVVTGFYEWGPWVNGGAWLTVDGQRVDFIYRGLEHLERVIADAEIGRYEVHCLQQPPFGFFSATYLGEITVCVPLFDPQSRLDGLKRRVADYPEALRQAVVQDYLFMAEFTLASFAPKFAARGDVYGTAACLARAVNELVMALFALNRQYPLNDKTALAEVAEFELAPREFGARVTTALAHLSDSAESLAAAVESVTQLARATIELTGGLYHRKFATPT
jgi:predicted nucleotidyltransferase